MQYNDKNNNNQNVGFEIGFGVLWYITYLAW